MKFWQHDETGLITTCDYKPSGRWYEIPVLNEDELPEMSNVEYDRWYALSAIVDGVRVGPTPFAAIPLPQRLAALQQVAPATAGIPRCSECDSTEPEVFGHYKFCSQDRTTQHEHAYTEGGRHCIGCGVLREGVKP